MRVANISAIYKGKGEVTDLDSDRGIFIVSIFRYILMRMLYADKYDIIESSMSASNIGVRKKHNIRNHIFVVNSIIHDVLSKKSNEPIDIMVLDYKQMFDSECLFECMNDVYEAGVTDDKFALIYEANRENFVAVQTPNGLSRRETFHEIVMQGDVLAPLISSLQVDTMGKECLEESKHLYYYKGSVPIPPLGMVDDLFTISTCGFQTTMMNQFLNSKTSMKRLQFGTAKCVKLHVGKTQNETLCQKLTVGGWKVEVTTDSNTGKCLQNEYFGGQEEMGMKNEQMYLGDIISSDGAHTKNVQNRKNKGLGKINEIMQILQSLFFGKYYFEVALVLRSSLLLSSLLLNCEAWVNLSERNIRSLEQTDEILLTKILDCDANSSNVHKYLELGIHPVRYEIMKRKVLFLQYILHQEETSMVHRVFKATCDNPLKNDFVKTCAGYLETLGIHLNFEEIRKLSTFKFKKIVNQKTNEAAFKYLEEKKNEPGKQTKIKQLKYEKLEIQEYLLEGNRNTVLSKLIFKARGRNLDIKGHKKWKYEDDICVGCQSKQESEQELIDCPGLKSQNLESQEDISYSVVFGNNLSEMFKLAQIIQSRLKLRKKILDEPS
jgi:hypothetical protein